MRFTKLFCVLVLLGLVAGDRLQAQMTGEISGKVISQETGEALVGANVSVRGTRLGDATNIDGAFLIKNVPAGSYRLRITMIGFKSVEVPVTVEAGQTATQEVGLTPTVLEFESVTVTATRAPSLVTDVSAPTEVISSKDIALTNAQSLGEVLNSTTSVFVKDYGDRGGLKSVSIRGSTSSQVLVLIDGQRISPATGSGVDFSAIPTDNVERIEVVRGGNSALYGADATGGIINIITKSGQNKQRISGYGKASLGSFGNRILAANVGQQIGRFDYYAALNYTEIEDFKYLTLVTEKEETLKNSQFISREGFAKLGLQTTDDSKIVLSGIVYHDNKGTPGSYRFPTPEATTKGDRQNLSAVYTSRFKPWWENKVQVYHNRTKTEYKNPGSMYEPYSLTKDYLTGAELQQRATVNKDNVLTFGYTYRHESVDGTTVNKRDRDAHAGFLQIESEWHISDDGLFNKMMLIPAVRYDDYSDFGSDFSPKAGIVLSREGEHKIGLRGNVGRSFRAPGFYDLYWPDQVYIKGNPNLKTEESTDYDVGIIGTSSVLGSLEYEVTYFHSKLENEIVWEPDANWVYMPVNKGKSKRSGLETRLAFSPWANNLRLEANYTYLKATDETAGSPTLGKILVYRPKNILNLTATLSREFLDLTFAYRFVDKRFSTADNKKENRLDEYSYLEGNVSAKYKRGNVEYFARFEVTNLRNKAFQVLDGFPQPMRAVGTTFGVNF